MSKKYSLLLSRRAFGPASGASIRQREWPSLFAHRRHQRISQLTCRLSRRRRRGESRRAHQIAERRFSAGPQY